MAEPTSLAAGFGIAGAAFGIGSAIIGFDIAQSEFQLQGELAAISAGEIKEQRRFLEVQHEFQLASFGRQEEQIESQTGFKREELAAQKTLTELNQLSSRIGTAVERRDLRGAARDITQKGRIQAAEQSRSQAFRGRSAFERANTAVNLTALSDVGSRLEVSKQLGLLSEKQFETQFGQLETAGRQVESQREFLLQDLEAQREFSGEQLESQQRQLDFRGEALAAQGRAAQRGQEAGGIFGDIFGAIGGGASSIF